MNNTDDSSHGLDAHKNTSSSKWFKGPEFIWHNKTSWPAERTEAITDEDPQVKHLLIVNRITENSGMLSNQDVSMLQKADTEIIKICQACHFWKEIKAVNAGNRVPRTSSIHQLDPFVNKDGVLRVSERLVKSNLIHELKHLVLVPKYCNISS